jgi:hypothetical protein
MGRTFSTINRRAFLHSLSGTLAASALPLSNCFLHNNNFPASLIASASPSPSKTMRWPKLQGSPVLDSLHPVIEHSRDVFTHVDKILEVASWMAYEDLPFPEFTLPLGIGADNVEEAIDFTLVADTIDTAFTDFTTHTKFQVNYAGQHWSDSDAEFACLKRALDNNIPILDGNFLAKITREQLDQVFNGNIPMPMLDEKLAVLRECGAILAQKYGGRYHNFVRSCSPRLYDHGNGLIERLAKEFPRFNDVSLYDGHEIKIYKLAQLGVWILYATMHQSGKFHLEDVDKMTALADYIVPVGLRLLGITSYSAELEHAINTYQLIPRDSQREVEIRAHCLYATALLTEEINNIRASAHPGFKPEATLPPVIIPQIDARLWTHYHTTTWPHHLTQTIMY